MKPSIFRGSIPPTYAAEWKWDGIRIQAVSERGQRRLYTRTGDDISATFPDVLEALDFEGAIDGEMLVMRDGALATFGDLQQRLNRKTVDAKLLSAFPAAIRAYDLLLDGETDLRALPFAQRRERLEAFVARLPAARIRPPAYRPVAATAVRVLGSPGRPARRPAAG
jgi:DNA ligase 1